MAALKANDEAALLAIFGDKHKNLVVSGDKGAAKILGLNATTLEARMKKLGIERPSS